MEKIYILTHTAPDGQYTPQVFTTRQEARNVLVATYVGLRTNEDAIYSEELEDDYAEIVYNDDTYDSLNIYEVDAPEQPNSKQDDIITTTDDILVAIASWFSDHPQAAADCRHYVEKCDYINLSKEILDGIFGEEYEESYFDDIEPDEDDIIYPEEESVGERIITIFDDDYMIQEGNVYYIDKQKFTRIGISPNVGNYFKILIVNKDEGLQIFRIVNTDQIWAMCVKTDWPTKCNSNVLNNLQNMNK